MSQASPGWYPDPSGRFVQRYYDGERWTEHVADAAGNQDTDYPTVAPTGRVAGSGQGARGGAGYGRGVRPGQASGHPGRTTRDTGPTADSGRDRGSHEPNAAGRGRGQGGGYGRGDVAGYGAGEAGRYSAGEAGRYGEAAGGHEARHGLPSYGVAGGTPGYGGQGARGYEAGRDAGYGDRRQDEPPAQGSSGGPGYGGPGYESRGYGSPGGRADFGPTPYGQAAYQAEQTSTGGFEPTVGLIVTGLGGLLVLLSLFVLDFLSVDAGAALGGTTTVSEPLADWGGAAAPTALDLYSGVGRFLAILVVAAAIVVVLPVPQLGHVRQAPVVIAVACGAFAVWHGLAMMASGEGIDPSPTLGAYLGLVGFVAMAVGQFLRQPIGIRH